MKINHPQQIAIRLAGFTLAAALLLILLFVSATTQPARADGGGIPTATRTPRPTRTATPTLIPTGSSAGITSGLPFPPTNTFTPVANAINQGQPVIGLEGETEAMAQEGGFSLINCWPFALVFLIVAVAGIWWLSNRIRQDIRA